MLAFINLCLPIELLSLAYSVLQCECKDGSESSNGTLNFQDEVLRHQYRPHQPTSLTPQLPEQLLTTGINAGHILEIHKNGPWRL